MKYGLFRYTFNEYSFLFTIFQHITHHIENAYFLTRLFSYPLLLFSLILDGPSVLRMIHIKNKRIDAPKQTISSFID